MDETNSSNRFEINEIESLLKHQITDENGLYTWSENYYHLDVNSGVLRVNRSNDSEITNSILSLDGSKYAKKWAISSSAIGGYGFDVVWSSGRIWSFLAPDETTCQEWVDLINRSIKLSSLNSVSIDERLPYSASFNDYSTKNSQSSPRKNVGKQNDVTYVATQSDMLTPQNVKSSLRNSELKTTQKYNDDGFNNLRPELVPSSKATTRETVRVGGHEHSLNISAIPHMATSSDSSPESNEEVNKLVEVQALRPPAPVQPFNMSSMYRMYNDHSQEAVFVPSVPSQPDEEEEGKTGLHFRSQAPNTNQNGNIFNLSFESNVTEKDLAGLVKRCRQLTNALERARADADIARSKLSEVEDQMSQRVATYERRLASVSEREVSSAMNFQSEVENAVIRATSESRSIHEASIRVLKEQHRRELDCLAQQLSEDRSRCAEMVLTEKRTREDLEDTLVNTKHQLSQLASSEYSLTDQLRSLEQQRQIERELFEKEKRDLMHQNERMLQRISEEKSSLAAKLHSDYEQSILEMTHKFDCSVQEVERNVRKSLHLEFQQDKFHSIRTMELKTTNDIKSALAEERRLHQLEMTKIKNTYLDREDQTSKDLALLEELHGRKVSQLESEILHFQERAEYIEQLYESEKIQDAKLIENVRLQSVQTLKSLEDQSKKAEDQERRIVQIQNDLQQSKSMEAKYREKMGELLEENRIQRMQLLNLQKQFDIDSAHASTWKNASKESEISLNSYNSALRIAHEEVLMLENENKRILEENVRLKSALSYADKIVYGTNSNSSSHASNGDDGKGGLRRSSKDNSLISSTSRKSVNRTQSPSPWKPPAGHTAGLKDKQRFSTHNHLKDFMPKPSTPAVF